MIQFFRIDFNEIDVKDKAPLQPGIYKIYAKMDSKEIPLKVGISINLRKRLLQHAASKQKYLTLKPHGNVVSKRSILAKHLYFEKLFEDYDLKTEQGRQRFLQEKCYILFCVTESRALARELERTLEAEGHFRYVGRPNPNKSE